MLYMIQKNNHAIYAMLINRWNHICEVYLVPTKSQELFYLILFGLHDCFKIRLVSMVNNYYFTIQDLV